MVGKKEAQARIKINRLLEETGWRFFDTKKGKANILLENNVKITEDVLNELGEDFQKTKNGFIDFLLLDDRGFPLIVLEAKSEDKSPLDGKEKARKYAKSQNVRFVILSNGNLHYFWDLESGNPYVIITFPTQYSVSSRKLYKPNPEAIGKEKVETNYLVLTQKPDYKKDPRWDDSDKRDSFIKDNDLKFLREYQLKAIEKLQEAVKHGSDRFLFEMATGTGKTLVSAAVIKLFLRTGNAKRVLFLVDRLELEDQAWKNFIKWLKNDYKTIIYKENRDDWRKAEIVVTTVQSLLFNNKYRDLFSPTDFDLVISDEAHRSISGNSRAVFEYFLGYKLGLTATPKDYLKKINPTKLSERDPRQLERRQLIDTYKTFGCKSGNPTFRYSLIDGVKEGYLVNPIVADARTEITTEILSEMGYAVMIETEDGNKEEKIFYQKDFEKKFFSEKTNKILCETFISKALKDPITGEIGKSIIFCVSQTHASKITQLLNEIADKMYPSKYNSDFAVQVTSNITDSQQMAVNFANNNLNGHTRFADGYNSSKTRVCVTYGMMTTGYDCEDILNLCLMRPIFSPTDFIQIKGRGTRKYNFTYRQKNELEETEVLQIEKQKFKLFDFFANCEYFEEKFNYDEILKLPKGAVKSPQKEDFFVRETLGEYENYNYDPLKTIKETEIGIQGMRIDRELFDRFEQEVKANKAIKEKFESGNVEEAEEHIKKEIFDKPEDYFNLEKLRRALKLDRRISLREILDKIFGRIKKFKNKDELLEEEIEKFISIYKPDAKYIHVIRNFIKAYITDMEIREIMEKREYSRLATNPRLNMNDLRELHGWRNDWDNCIIGYIKDYVSLNAFV